MILCSLGPLQSRKLLSMLFTFKDKINKMLHSNLVNKFKCNVCSDIYYGKTKDIFKVRACEHLGITPLMVGHSLKKTAHVFPKGQNVLLLWHATLNCPP